MSECMKLAVVGVGRIGLFHARYVQELSREREDCELVAVVDGYEDLSERTARQLQPGQEREIRAFKCVEDLLTAESVDGAVIASRTEDHYGDAKVLIDAGLRVLLEKPLTSSLETARQFAAYLNGEESRKQSLMQAFMRRFDAPLVHAKQALDRGAIGRPFKIVSVLEDPLPPPDGYNSPGLLSDMAVHNVDEVMWLVGARPEVVSGTGSRLYNQKIASVKEDFDDAFLQMWCADEIVAQVQVSRNHVAGYRNETWIYGEEGLIHVGAFQGDPRSVLFEVCGRKGATDRRDFKLPKYEGAVPVFIQRFGLAYKAEIAYYIEQCHQKEPFAVDHNDGVRALVVVDAGSRALETRDGGVSVEYTSEEERGG